MPVKLNSGDDYHYTAIFVLSAASATSAIQDDAERDVVIKQLIKYLIMSVGRVYENTIAKLDAGNEPWRVNFPGAHLNHITDWLYAAIINDEPWLKKLDDQGRPKKLMKFGSFEQILKEADKAMLKAAQKGKAIKLDDEDEQLFMELADGYRLVRLLTPAALDRESAHMQHCIGGGAYDLDVLNRDKSCFLSLRDAMNKPHVTIELGMMHSKHLATTNYKLWQISGKQNAPPVRKYLEVLMPFFQRKDVLLFNQEFNMGFIFDIDRTPYFLEDQSIWPEAFKSRIEGLKAQVVREYSSIIERFPCYIMPNESVLMDHAQSILSDYRDDQAEFHFFWEKLQASNALFSSTACLLHADSQYLLQTNWRVT